ncbi:uncharacterized protein A4U43_C01F16620 [Asparagus officinalis]|uniref:Uncharacterized protein n=1 Tax=Asparagus officinalis TaxID=4686 RepID=A0A5P1FUF9_ASPOF|nr:protein GRIM REAPER-like [Asparagus officinalis]ONK80341.1 uncharacterized protein A4U43_C01F16620 [Asparagus officinalis]
MASTSLSLAILFLIITLSSISKTHQTLSPRPVNRFVKENPHANRGDKCNSNKETICPNDPAKNGTDLLSCCKNRCVDVLRDRSNCGGCGVKCGFGQLCCNGLCTVVAYDVNNCGKCANVCASGVKCEYGVCGYA